MQFHKPTQFVWAFCLALLVSVAGLAPTLWSQSTSGDVVGTMVDPTGAVIPGGTVTATDVATGVETKADVNAQGEFHIPNLLVGTYDITGSAKGFATFTLRNFTVTLNATSTATLVLPIATATTTMQVSADAHAVIDTTTTQLQTSFQTEELQNLPTSASGLGVLNLSLLETNVSSSGGMGNGTGPAVGGQRPRNNNYTIEGIDNNKQDITGPVVLVPNDAVGEFSAITDQFSPEFGHSNGGQFNVTVRSGTNTIHGRVYEYFQNRDLNAENAIQGGKVPNARYDDNRYGGQVGGPIKKDKLFYFANYERHTIGQNLGRYVCTPTAAGFQTLSTVANLSATNLGIFTKYAPVAPSQVTSTNDNACFDESTGSQYLTVYDGTTYNSKLGVYGSGNAYSIPLGNVLVASPEYSNHNAFTTSTDWTISSKDSFRGRYIYNSSSAIDTNATLPQFFLLTPVDGHIIALSEFHDFTPNLMNEARLGYNRGFNQTPIGNFTFPGLNMFPNLVLADTGGLNIGPDQTSPAELIQNTYEFTDNLIWTKGKHSLKFGFEGRKYISPEEYIAYVRGLYEYNFLTEYLHDLAPTDSGQRATGNSVFAGNQTSFAGYVNDVYRITQKMAFNLGLRYEFTSVQAGERQQSLNQIATVPGLIAFNAPKPQRLNFLPRVGIAYEIDPRTSVRAGFGIAKDILYDNIGTLTVPPELSQSNLVGGAGNPAKGSASFLANGGLPSGSGVTTFSTAAAAIAATTSYVPDQKFPYAETWSLSLEHVFAQNYTVEMRYVGNHGLDLVAQTQLNILDRVTAANQLPTYMEAPSTTQLATLTNTLTDITSLSDVVPAYSAAGFAKAITAYMPWGQSNYNAGSISVNRQFTRGFALVGNYTWSKMMDDASGDTYTTTLTPRRPENFQDLRPEYSRSGLDHTHRVTIFTVYDLPFFKRSNWVLRNTLGNWEIAPVYTYESPEYFTVLSGVNSVENGDSATQIDRTIYNTHGVKHTASTVNGYANPTLTGLCSKTTTATDPNGTLLCNADLVAYVPVNPNAEYIQAGAGTLPTAQRNTEPMRPIDNFDATAIKRFNFGEERSLEFQAQAYNLLNHSQFVPGSVNNISQNQYKPSTPLYQLVTNTASFDQPGKFFTANARAMQLTLKFSF